MADAFAAVFPARRGRAYSKASYLTSQVEQGHLKEAFEYLKEFMSEHFREDTPGKPASRWPEEVHLLANTYAEALVSDMKTTWTNSRLTKMFKGLGLDVLTTAVFWQCAHDRMHYEVLEGRHNAFSEDSDFDWMLSYIRNIGFFEVLGNAMGSVIINNPNGWLLDILDSEEHLEFMYMIFEARGGEVLAETHIDNAPEHAWSSIISRSIENLEHILSVNSSHLSSEFSPQTDNALIKVAIVETLRETALDYIY